MSAAEMISLRRFGDDQIVTLAKLVVETAFQPIVETASGAVFGYESLMRGHDRLGFRSPLDLLDRAHEAGQLLALEHMVNSRALAAFAALPDFASRTLFINLDSRLVTEAADVVDRLSGHLKRAGIPASSICFEISERFDNGSMPEFGTLIARLRQEGFKLAIDDFGAGHSGMKALCDHPFDYLKIDRHFMSGLDADARKRHLVKSTVNLAHVLGIRVIAEGVETEAEFVACRDCGCDLVQGWYIARPQTDMSALQAVYAPVARAATGRRNSASLDSILIRRQIEHLPAVHESDSLESVFELFRRDPRRTFFPVLNANDEPRGILHEYHVREVSYHPFGRDLLKNRIYQKSLSNFSTMAPVADLETPAEQLLSIFADMGGSECVILTENMRYAGILSASSLLKIISEKQLKNAEDQNPLTSLPGNRSIHDYLQDRTLDGDQLRCFCYFDFDNFKPFNDHYGFQMGDRAILQFASLLRRHFIGEDVFIGHLGGDDFFAGVSGRTVSAVRALIERLLGDFAHEARQLYAPADLLAGVIRGHDRDGNERNFPLMRCSAVVLIVPEEELVADPQQISARIATLKGQAKTSKDGIVFFGADPHVAG
ncbi:diguanylate cyclase (GGDEF)-like protein [Rhizobium azooxidifex]|uniref:Diguanylate cyclase (GGDEF)-like protein n=1 Tax=Mycoplana azooxidifex TaxID=1636188 RepID=A0A7W6GHG9_9HYPH|nr:bifunctional diguanylate cyclase/phosphodiesterase [Mycoplana azooxidifex]MBB3975991.1 diguanylate cyclase (GGDEF)-like protein [Mycoplana azooxidifex]